ncbi:MAG TPA: hypothetical protein DDZ51_02340 [Planctomycetaceae bacterium]|nr:hypothetical protein [Planctomycetaceae bacterium]
MPGLPSPAAMPLRPSSAGTGMPGQSGVCDHCGSMMIAGVCTGGKPGMPCQAPGSGNGKGSAPNSANAPNSSGSPSGKATTPNGQQPNSANSANSAAGGKNGGSMPPLPPMPSGGNDPLANAQAIAARAAANLAAAQAGGNMGNPSASPLGNLADLFNSVQAGAAVGPGLRWNIVKPAGVGDPANLPAISMDEGATEIRGGGRKAFQLDAGIVRSELVTGPNNPLLVPRDVASVVYVIDCSSSMSGDRFNRVARGVIDAVSQMTDQQQFAVLLFNTVAMQIDGGGLIPATDANRQILATQLSQVLPVGGTDPTDALLIALQMKPETMVVFSDGEFDRSIVQRVTSLNRASAKRIQINCVGIQSTVSVLRDLASMNGPGNYIEAP